MSATLAERYCSVNSILHMAYGLATRYRCAMDIIAIRKSRLLWLAGKFGGYKEGGFAELGKKVGKDPNVFSQIHTGNRNMGNRLARELETELGLDHGIMDTPLEADMRRRNVDELIKTALGKPAVDPETKGPIRHKPHLVGLKNSAKVSNLKRGTTPKEEHQPAPSVAPQKGRKRGAR